MPGHGDLDAGPAHASGRQETWGGPTTPAGTGAAPSSPPRHGDPDVGPAHTSGASAGAGAAALQEWDTASPAAPAPGAAGGAHPGDHRDDTAATEPVPAAAPWDPHSTDSTAERARSLLVPVSDPEPRAPASPAVAPVLPGRPVAARPQVRAPGPESGPTGGIPCPWCATPNLPDRHFCGRCAMPMAGDGRQTPGRLPWWRRTAFFRAAEIPWAGDRPRLRRGFGRVMNWVVGALVLALIVTLVLNVGAGVDATRDHFAKRAPVDPVSVKASRSYPGHGAQLVVDKVSNTWWGPGVTQSGEGQWLEARFDEPTRLLDLIITPGVSTRTQQLSQSALPRRIEARITTADEKTTTRIINLDRSAGGQRRKFRAQEVTSVRFIVRSAYTADDKKQVAIAEIEFFGRSNSNTS
ncbi:zinc ribbon domain-containing protein [Streptomyces sp. NPDC050704]|uniref:NADase-type glycan-binding domain-containing protein n=1 Tax=Streptomyces sp. NPDC050704 TaxID=3157219 RepID=UPI00343E868C